MGNWRTVTITGTMSAADSAKLRALLDWGDYMSRDHQPPPETDCLSFSTAHPGLCGLGNWPAEKMDRSGNLHERDYSVEDVAAALRVLVHAAPSMLLKVHCGGEYESDECVATISVGEGLVVTGKPEKATVDGPSTAQMQANLMANLYRSG
jgi:hypothetical protein